ncbi:unnamed protein product [Chrysoparadoxa australica]
MVLHAGEMARPLTMKESASFIEFLINVFQSLEEPAVRSSVLKLTSLPLWGALGEKRRAQELKHYPQLKRHWLHLEEMEKAKTKSKAKAKDQKKDYTATFLPLLISNFLNVVEGCKGEGALEPGVRQMPFSSIVLLYCERFMELLIDLLGQLPTRRFLHVVLDSMKVAERCSLSALGREDGRKDGRLFRQLVDMFTFYLGFEINDQTGTPLTDNEVSSAHLTRLHLLQRLAFKYYKQQLPDLPFVSTVAAGKRDFLEKTLGGLPEPVLRDIATRLCVVEEAEEASDNLVLHTLVNFLCERQSQIAKLREIPLCPNEELLWDENVVPPSQYYNGQVMALPKMNLQFLTVHDYLLRSFELFRLESAYEVRDDLEDAIKRMSPTIDYTGAVKFGGWARKAMPIASFAIKDVQMPKIGEKAPARVRGEIVLNLSGSRGPARDEWESLREHDVVFLVAIQDPMSPEQINADKKNAIKFPAKYGVRAVRGMEVRQVLDEAGNSLNDPSNPEQKKPVGAKRTLKVWLDAAQYHNDVQGDGLPVYDALNLLVRRDAKENNFKGILETIRDLMNTEAVGSAIPPWLHDVFLGYGDPGSAHYKSMPGLKKASQNIDFQDTFLDASHAVEVYGGANVTFQDESRKKISKVAVMGRLWLAMCRSWAEEPGNSTENDVKKWEKGFLGVGSSSPLASQDSAKPPFRLSFASLTLAPMCTTPGPYPADVPKRNSVRFTSVQLEAIRSGMSEGLTMVVGPPGTGKTDVAVQIISNLYHEYPQQRILLVTHSNAALNDLFEKIMLRDIDERHLLRLGAGEKELRRGVAKDFSKGGRVNHSLSRRLECLEEVSRLAKSINVEGDIGYTCETAEHFELYHILSLKEQFAAQTQGVANPDAGLVSRLFPFKAFFSNAPDQPLFHGKSFADDMRVAHGCFRHLDSLFEELKDYRAFELLRHHSARADYLLTKQARIVAMTCTHAALMRSRLVELGFKYDSLVMEESAQILEVETFIPMMLQEMDPVVGCRLKRVTLIGDHHQLPPVIKSMAFQKYSKLDQSLFSRFIRLGTPAVQLDAQGRARSDIAQLYSWRYKELGNLPNVTSGNYLKANAGFVHDFQLINVPDFQGVGESSPTAYFYQNLGEAEFVVATYQYMRLMGYPAEKISILTTYNGQMNLLRDVLGQRCRNSLFGMPGSVETVDKYQGQQNDYVLLSLVRTKTVGHVRDVRRLVVAMSRARLGLYVFCREKLFSNCFELMPTFKQLTKRPSSLQLLLNEQYPTDRLIKDKIPEENMYNVAGPTEMGILVHQMASTVFTAQQAAEQAKAALAAQEVAKKAAEDEAEAAIEEAEAAKAAAEEEAQAKKVADAKAAAKEAAEDQATDPEDNGGEHAY